MLCSNVLTLHLNYGFVKYIIPEKLSILPNNDFDTRVAIEMLAIKLFESRDQPRWGELPDISRDYYRSLAVRLLEESVVKPDEPGPFNSIHGPQDSPVPK